jgi:hypothetical protein
LWPIFELRLNLISKELHLSRLNCTGLIYYRHAMMTTGRSDQNARFIDSKIKELRPLLKLLAKCSSNRPGSLTEPDPGFKYRMPRWYYTLKALFQDHESENQANIISLMDSCFIDEDESSHVSSTDHGSETPLSNNEEDEVFLEKEQVLWLLRLINFLLYPRSEQWRRRDLQFKSKD